MRAGTSKHLVLSALVGSEPMASAVIVERTDVPQATVSAILCVARSQGLCTSDGGEALAGPAHLWSLTAHGRNVLGVDAEGKPTRTPPTREELDEVRSAPAGWTDARRAMAEKLYARLGWTASETARAIGGGLSRNAVISLSHRAGWIADRVTSTPGAAFVRPSAPRAIDAAKAPKAPPKPKATARPPVLRLVETTKAPEPEMPAVTHDDTAGAVLALGSIHCRWPIGDPSKAGFRFCCRPKTGRAYCNEHARAAYTRPIKHEKAHEYARSLRRFCAV